MENKIILISNKGVRPKRTFETLFKNSFNKSMQRLRCAQVVEGSLTKKYQLILQEAGSEYSFIHNALEQSNSGFCARK